MRKEFNVTGVCIPEKHYMVDVTGKLEAIEGMVSRGDYFVINRPRQYGKTTTIYLLEEQLKTKYLVISCSFEGLGDASFATEAIFVSKIIKLFSKSLRFSDRKKSEELIALGENATDMDELGDVITDFVMKCDRRVVLFIDEVDKSSNNQLFLHFLGMLRNKYLLREQKKDYTFHSVILAGVHDVKNLMIKFRHDEEMKLNSPWNIAVTFNVKMSFNPNEIETMLIEYAMDNGLDMNTALLSERIYYYTSGYPFLVSRLCQIIDQQILRDQKCNWTQGDIDKSVEIVLKERSTLFDDLIKNLENNKELATLVQDIVIDGSDKAFNTANPLIHVGEMYGIFKEEEYRIKLHNRIYEQYIYDYLISKLQLADTKMSNYNFRNNFITSTGSLDIHKILIRYQQFIKENYSGKDNAFLENNGRLLFLAFIKPIINGVGFDFKEVQISEEKRLDVVITYGCEKYIIELKIWRGKEYHQSGLNQLVDYLDNQEKETGFLLLYNFNKNKEYIQETVEVDGKTIFVVFV